jgi:hypothetical protein
MKITMPLPLFNFPVCTHKILAGCVALFILLSSVVPRFALTGNDYRVLSQVIQTQSLLFSYFSLSALPLTIVYDLFDGARQNPAQQPEKESTGSGPNPSTDYSLMNNDSRAGAARLEQQRAGYPARAGVSPECRVFPMEALTALGRVIAPPGYLCLFVIMFFFLLPRSSVGEYAARLFLLVQSSAQLWCSSWVFSLSIHHECVRSLS